MANSTGTAGNDAIMPRHAGGRVFADPGGTPGAWADVAASVGRTDLPHGGGGRADPRRSRRRAHPAGARPYAAARAPGDHRNIGPSG